MTRFVSNVVSILFAMSLSCRSLAIIIADSPSSTIRFPIAETPAAFTAGPVTILTWVHAAEVPQAHAAIIQLPGVFDLSVSSSSVSARGWKSANLIEASAPISLPTGEWALLALSYDPALARLVVFARAESTPATVTTFDHDPAFLNLSLGPASAALAIGAHPSGLPALVGAYATTVLRDHPISLADFDAVWESRDYWAPYALDNSALGGAMNGSAGCAWMTNHSVTTEPINASGAPGMFDRAAILGQPATAYNIHVYDRAFPLPNEWDRTRVVRKTTLVSAITYATHREPPFSSFFALRTPDEGIPPQFVPRISPKALQLATAPEGLLKVIVSANSRAIRGSDGTGLAPGHFASGFEHRNRPRLAGVLNRPAVLSGGGNPWLGFDLKSQSARYSTNPAVQVIATDAEPFGDFSRFWTSQGKSNRGPGLGVFVPANGYYGMRCKPEPGTLLLKEEPLTVRAYLLRFPGASDVTWLPDQGTAQKTNPKKNHPGTSLSLDTTTWSHTISISDSVSSRWKVFLRTSDALQVIPGDACHITAGSASGSTALVREVTPSGDGAWIDFVHPLGGLPSVGSVLHFGPWGFEVVTHPWPGLPANDDEAWRGLSFEAGPTGAGFVVYAFSAWRPDVDGYAFGIAGWGGHGYARQIDESSPEIIRAWMTLLEADVWIQGIAQQSSEPSAMSSYANLVRQALPEVELVMAGDIAHHLNPLASWHQYILDHAAEHDAIGLSILQDPRVGTVWEQYADNLRTDIGHLTLRGNRLIADLWTELIAKAAIDPCAPADFEGDGDWDIFDFLAFQNAFALEDPRADFEGDGDWDIFDFLAFQNAFAQCAR